MATKEQIKELEKALARHPGAQTSVIQNGFDDKVRIVFFGVLAWDGQASFAIHCLNQARPRYGLGAVVEELVPGGQQ